MTQIFDHLNMWSMLPSVLHTAEEMT